MRAILFRGKRTDNGEWVYGALAKFMGMDCKAYTNIIKETDGVNYMQDTYQVDPATVGQYAGLLDMKAVKVYEGDFCIVKRPGMLACGFITFNKGCFLFEEKGTRNLLRLCDMEINGYQIEVRGNIHDNPELIK